MKIGSGTKFTKEETRKERNRKNNIKRIVISLLVAIVVFISLVVIQSSILHKEEAQRVYQVVKDITSGTKISEENFDDYLKIKEVQVSLIPDGYLTADKKAEIVGKFVNRDYKVKDIITSDALTDTERLYKDNIENPIEISFASNALGTVVAGTIREGDFIDFYGLRKDETTVVNSTGLKTYNQSSLYEVDKEYSFKHVYVTEVFNGEGQRIKTDGDLSTPAVMFTVILSEKDGDLFNEMIKNCDIYISKLIYDPDTDYQSFIDEANKEAGQSSYSETQPREIKLDTTDIDDSDDDFIIDTDETAAEIENEAGINDDTTTTDTTDNTTATEGDVVEVTPVDGTGLGFAESGQNAELAQQAAEAREQMSQPTQPTEPTQPTQPIQ